MGSKCSMCKNDRSLPYASRKPKHTNRSSKQFNFNISQSQQTSFSLSQQTPLGSMLPLSNSNHR